MKKRTPIKRNSALQPLSREHHQGLLLCWKIRTGFNKGVDEARIKAYCDWFWNNHLQTHFKVEEKFVFPILGNENASVKQALAEHQRLQGFFQEKTEITAHLRLIETELDQHIRFEERVLFNEIQNAATPEQLEQLAKQHHSETTHEDWKDEFWT